MTVEFKHFIDAIMAVYYVICFISIFKNATHYFDDYINYLKK